MLYCSRIVEKQKDNSTILICVNNGASAAALGLGLHLQRRFDGARVADGVQLSGAERGELQMRETTMRNEERKEN